MGGSASLVVESLMTRSTRRRTEHGASLVSVPAPRARGCHHVSPGCHLGVTWVSPCVTMCHLGVTWVSPGCHHVSPGCHLGVTRVSPWCNLGDPNAGHVYLAVS